jgi:hypothetical protein
MTTVMASFIAIVLFGAIMIGTISYGDALGMMSAPDSVALAQRVQSAVEAVSQVQSETGSRPTSVGELLSAGLPASSSSYPGDVSIRCDDETCTPMAVCVSIRGTRDNVVAATAAAGRVKGVVSGACGDAAAAVGDDVFITVTI